MVIVPAVASSLAIAAKYLSLRAGGYSVFAQVYGLGRTVPWLSKEAWAIGNGMHVAVLGIALTGVFFVRLLSKRSTLPLTLRDCFDGIEVSQRDWEGCKRLTWMCVSPWTIAIVALLGLLSHNAIRILLHYNRPTIWLSFLQDVAVAGVMIAIAMWMAGAENRKSVCRLLRLPSLNFLLIGLALPLIVTLMPAIVRFVLDRVHWAAQDFGRYMPPHFQEYCPFLNYERLVLSSLHLVKSSFSVAFCRSNL
jgi:hypothetical protein